MPSNASDLELEGILGGDTDGLVLSAEHLFTEDGERKLMIAWLRYGDTFVKLDRAWLFAERHLDVECDRDPAFTSVAPIPRQGSVRRRSGQRAIPSLPRRPGTLVVRGEMLVAG